MGKFRYLFVYTLPVLAIISFHSHGIWSYLPVLEAFVLIPIIELITKPNVTNLREENRLELKDNRYYLWALRISIPIQIFCGIYMLYHIDGDMDVTTRMGRVLSYGVLCGVMGINIAHELGHKTNSLDQFLAKVLLTTTLYTHFYIEHNYGHHKNVGTPEDASTARKGEWVYLFWIRSIVMSYLSAWRIGIKRSKGRILRNEMMYYTLVQLALLFTINNLFGGTVLIGFIGASITGWLLLETVQYIEHYGLIRKKSSTFRYENVEPRHSWNSNHMWGRAILFELSRHSDHHYLPNKGYPLLDHHEESPQLPTGYPGMMLLSLIPPLYMHIVDAKIHH
ncbi:MAG: alkane 1-monooxygenase [Flavobacteriales bacterium]|nr:alkane 1-monooxygenase [Flavobacteriales bacterium]